MHRCRKFLRFAVISLAFSILPGQACALTSLKTVTVLADSTMSVVISELARHYSREKNIVVNTSFATPAAQEAQIIEGAAADILITPQQSWIEKLKTQGLVDVYSQTLIARNKLVLVGPLESAISMNPAGGFPTVPLIRAMEGEPRFVLGNPETMMEGVYGKEAMRALDEFSEMEPYTLYVKRLDQMFEMVARYHGYGIFFYSSTISRAGVRVIGELPADSHRPIDYYGVVIASDNMNEARTFLDYLQSKEASRILRENGFAPD